MISIKNLNLEKLDATHNKKITNVNHMTNLKDLDASGNCGIDNDGIKNINPEKLNIEYNGKITDVKHMTNLKELIINKYSGIN